MFCVILILIFFLIVLIIQGVNGSVITKQEDDGTGDCKKIKMCYNTQAATNHLIVNTRAQSRCVISQLELSNLFVKLEFLTRSISYFTEAVAQRCSVKNVFLEIFQNSQENICARVSFLIKSHASTKKEDSGIGVCLRILRNF